MTEPDKCEEHPKQSTAKCDKCRKYRDYRFQRDWAETLRLLGDS